MKHKLSTLLGVFCVLFVLASVTFAESTDSYELKLFLGETMNLKTYVAMNNIPIIVDNQTVIQNMNASVATVNSTYMISTKAIGKGLLVLSRGNETVRIHLVVESPIEAITFDMDNLVMYVGEIQYLDYQIVSKVGFKGETELALQWESSKSRVATVVDSNRVVTHAAGNTKLTARDKSGEVVTTFEVSVLGHSNKLSVTSPNRLRRMNVGETVTLKATFGVKDVTQNIYWESLTPHVVKVDKYGLVTAVGEGLGRIRAQSSVESKRFDYEINAYSMIDKVQLNRSEVAFRAIGETAQLSFNLYPKDINNPPLLTGYTYKSSNVDVATVSENGLIRARGPGIALISVVFDDSQKTASCTVTVPENTDLQGVNPNPIKHIELDPYEGVALIGQKIPLTYSVAPRDASHQEVSFNVLNGDNNQVKEMDGNYYFIPNKRGNITLDVSADRGIKDSIMIPVTSAIDELKLSLSTYRVVDTNEEALYMGEMAQVLTRVYTKNGFEKSDVYPSSLKYSVADKEIVALIPIGNDYYVKGLKPGKTKIIVTNLENLHEETLWVSVENPIGSFSSDSQVTLPVGKAYSPRFNFTYNKGLNKLNGPLDLRDMTRISVKEFYLAESIIDEEILYEEFMIDQYGEGPFDLNTRDQLEVHRARLSQLQQYKVKAVNGYTLLNDVSALKDRNDRTYNFYTIRNNQIVSHYPSKMLVGLKLANTVYEAETYMVWSPNSSDFMINRLNNSYSLETLINQYQLSPVLTGRDSEEQVNLLITYINNRALFSKTPSYDLLKSVSKALNNGLLPVSLRNLEAEVTKADLALLAGQLHSKYVNKYWSSEDQTKSYYYDVVSNDLENSISLNYLQPTSQYYFGSNDLVKEDDVQNVFQQILPNYSRPTTMSNRPLTGERLLLLIGNLIK